MKKILIFTLIISTFLIISCSNLSNKCDKENDKDSCYLTLAETSKDKSACEKIQDKNLGVNCVLLVDKSEKSLEECKKIQPLGLACERNLGGL